VPKDFEEYKSYNTGFVLNELFVENSVGIVTARDEFTIHYTKTALQNTIESFISLDDETGRYKFNLGKDVRDWQVKFAKRDLLTHYPNKGNFVQLNYRPFDNRWTFYTGKSKGFHCYPRAEVMQHFLNRGNLGLVFKLGNAELNSVSAMVTDKIIDFRSWSRSGMQGGDYVAPLYLYPKPLSETELADNQKSLEAKLEEAKMLAENFEKIFPQMQKMYNALPNPTEDLTKYYKEQEKHLQKLEAKVELFKQQLLATTSQNLFEEEKRRPNLNTEIVNQIAESLGLTFTNEKENKENTFAPIDLLDYMYAVLHSPTYREKYKEFLKIDFPRVPYPKDVTTFWNLVKLGGQIRQIHLLESPTVEKYSTQYPINGDNVVSKVKYFEGKVYINDTQYFDNVPEIAWNFYIGGYQPAQKWLKDRKERSLEFEDILHYQKIIVALTETNRLMKEIDRIEI
jgi:predicted helicase